MYVPYENNNIRLKEQEIFFTLRFSLWRFHLFFFFLFFILPFSIIIAWGKWESNAPIFPILLFCFSLWFAYFLSGYGSILLTTC